MCFFNFQNFDFTVPLKKSLFKSTSVTKMSIVVVANWKFPEKTSFHGSKRQGVSFISVNMKCKDKASRFEQDCGRIQVKVLQVFMNLSFGLYSTF